MIESGRVRFVTLWVMWLSALSLTAWGQAVDVANRPINKVTVQGLKEVEAKLLENVITVKAGDAYDAAAVAKDIENMTRLGRFAQVAAQVHPNPDGTVDLTYVVLEQRLLADVQIVGNKNKADGELLDLILLRAGDPIDPFLIQRAQQQIRDHYQKDGYFLAEVTVDEQLLNDEGILLLRIREGPQPKVRQVKFEGNDSFPAELLQSKIRTNTYIFIFRKGLISDEQLVQDVDHLRRHYLDNGYLDVRVGRVVETSDDQKDVVVTFVISEGRQYTVANLSFMGNRVLSTAQLIDAITLKAGDVFSADKQRTSEQAIKDLYGKLAFIEAEVAIQRTFHETEPRVDLQIAIEENNRYLTGNVIVRGNELTQDKVVRRHIRRLDPGRPMDSTGIPDTETRIRETGLFREAKVTVLGTPEEEYRDVLVEVKEANTGSLSFGAAISSDSGVFGAIELTQRNFDAADGPESWGEFFTGRAFRGAGQYFSIVLQPGNEFQRYQVNFREPYLFDTNLFLDTSVFYFTRFRENWDEERLGGTAAIGRRFGDVWSASVRTRFESVDISDIEDDAPIDAFAVEGSNDIASLGFNISRDTTDSRFFPTRGTRTVLGIEEVGAIGGDFDFTRASVNWDAFVTLDEDFFGRKTVLKFKVDTGYIFNADTERVTDDTGATHRISGVPLFERFYAGGHRSFRGFRFRGMGPRGIRNDTGREDDDPVGGEFMFLFGTEYDYPIWQDVLRGVLFVDTGTIHRDDISLKDYRLAIGTGLRLKLPIFGQAPFALDFAHPLLKEDGDETRVFSFDIALPF